MREIYEFEGFRVDARRRLLTRAGRGVPLTPKAFETLLVLLRGGGRLLTKDEIISEVWPDTFVEEGSLAQNIFLLRRALGEGKGEHRFIVTVPGAGYLFVPRVHDSRAAAPPCAPTDDRAIGSLAVAPFRALGVDERDEPLGAGLADALTRRLSCLRGVKVLPTSAALGLGGSGSQGAGVEALLHGLYQRDGARLRVSVQLARVCDGALAAASSEPRTRGAKR